MSWERTHREGALRWRLVPARWLSGGFLAQALQRITTWDAHSIATATAMPAEIIARWTGQTIPDPTIIDLTHWRTRRPASHPRPSLH